MPVHFNGEVNVNGTMNVSGNGNVQITDSHTVVNAADLLRFVRETVPNSPHLSEYEEAARLLPTTQDVSVIERSLKSLKKMFNESAKAFWIAGLSETAQQIAARLETHIR